MTRNVSAESGVVLAVSRSAAHTMSKPNVAEIRLIAGLGVQGRDEHGGLIRKAGVMAVVLTGGVVRAGDAIMVELPPEPYGALGSV